jgi:hypothetical protein
MIYTVETWTLCGLCNRVAGGAVVRCSSGRLNDAFRRFSVLGGVAKPSPSGEGGTAIGGDGEGEIEPSQSAKLTAPPAGEPS